MMNDPDFQDLMTAEHEQEMLEQQRQEWLDLDEPFYGHDGNQDAIEEYLESKI